MQPINANASPAARNLLDYIAAVPDGAILTGQHNYPATLSKFTGRAVELTGQHPSVWGQDFGFGGGENQDSVVYRQRIIDEAVRQHDAGSIITLMWHAVRPIDDEPATFREHVQGDFSIEQYTKTITPGTELNARWQAQVDKIASFLKQIATRDIPVLWRPYHEMNGKWFWWGKGTPDHFRALWDMLYERITTHHAINNLIWVWNANAPVNPNILHYADIYPGHDRADILATDVYGDRYFQDHYEELLDVAGGKPVAVGECGAMPTPEIVERQPAWRWFMTWTDHLDRFNEVERVRAMYGAEAAINRDDPRGWKAWRDSHEDDHKE